MLKSKTLVSEIYKIVKQCTLGVTVGKDTGIVRYPDCFLIVFNDSNYRSWMQCLLQLTMGPTRPTQPSLIIKGLLKQNRLANWQFMAYMH